MRGVSVINWSDWYTDTVDVWRVVEIMDGKLTRQERRQVLKEIPCRVYEDNDRAINMEQAAANIRQESMLACDNSVEIQEGDELILHRGARLGKITFDERAFAGNPHYYFEPFGAVIPGLAHQEIHLLQQERVKGGGADDAGGTNQTAESKSATN